MLSFVLSAVFVFLFSVIVFCLLSFIFCILLLYCVCSSSVLSIVSLRLLFGHVVRVAVLLSLVNAWYVLRRLQRAVFVLLYPSS